jgi:uncharacterized membrane protein
MQAGVLAANTDRERAVDVLKAGFAEGRLTKAEYDDRTARVFAARTYGELGSLIADLPAGPLGGPPLYPVGVYPPPVRPALSSRAVSALVCGLAVFPTFGLTGVPAIVLGHAARREMRQTGQRGDGMALAGIALGWAGIAIIAIVVAGLVTIMANAHGMQNGVGQPVPGPGIKGQFGGN